MKSIQWGVRTKLTLSAVVIVTALYLALGLTVEIAAREAILGSVDNGLRDSARGFSRGHRPPPHRDGPGDGPHDGEHRDHDHGDHDQRDGDRFGPPGGPPGGPPDGPEHDQLPPRQPVAQEIDIHDTRPRIVWRDPDARMPFPSTLAFDLNAVPRAKKGLESMHTIIFQNEPIRVLTFPIYSPDKHRLDGVVELTYWLGDIYKTLNSLENILFLILPMGILLMGGASLFVVGRTLKPVKEIRTAAAKIEAEDLSRRLEVQGSDEFADLADTMNGMLARLEVAFAGQQKTNDQLREVILQQRRFTADASHELKTPLTVVKINASFLRPAVAGDEQSLESIVAIDEAVNRMSKLVQDLLLLARTDSGQLTEQFSPIDLKTTVEHAATLVPCADKLKIQTPNDPVEVNGSQFALERLITNLVENACRHTKPDGEVQVLLTQSSGSIELTVSDNGEGVPPEHLEKIFERFHRVDSSRQSETGGAGLGLAICKGIVEAHGGTITATSPPGQGATFKVHLPKSQLGDPLKPTLQITDPS